MRDSFIFYRSFAEAGKTLKDKDRLALYDAIIALALDEEEKPLRGITGGMFSLIKPQIETNNKKYKQGCKGKEFGAKGGRPKNPIGVIEDNKIKTPKGLQEKTPNVNENENDNENDNEKENIKEKATRFLPPTLDEVVSYCQERNNSVDAERWFNFYKSKGWMVGSNKMKDWKAAVRTWEKRDSKPNYSIKNSSLSVTEEDLRRYLPEGSYEKDKTLGSS